MEAVPPGSFNEDKWELQSIVEVAEIQRDIASTSDPLEEEYFNTLRYSYATVSIFDNRIDFQVNAYVSPLRSRMDRAFRDYAPSISASLNDLNNYTLLDPAQNASAGNPDADPNIPIYPDGDNPYYSDQRTWAPATNKDYPESWDSSSTPPPGGKHPLFDNTNGWIPIYNPLLSHLRAFGTFEELIERMRRRTVERNTLPISDIKYISNAGVDIIDEIIDELFDNAIVEVDTIPGVREIDYNTFQSFKFQPTCPKPLPPGQINLLYRGTDSADFDNIKNYDQVSVDDCKDCPGSPDCQ